MCLRGFEASWRAASASPWTFRVFDFCCAHDVRNACSYGKIQALTLPRHAQDGNSNAEILVENRDSVDDSLRRGLVSTTYSPIQLFSAANETHLSDDARPIASDLLSC